MGNIALGLKSAHYAQLVSDAKGACSYNVPVSAPDVQEIGFTPNVQNVDVPGDDGIAATLTAYSTAAVTATFAHQSAQTKGFLLGERRESNGIMVSGKNDSAPYVALGYIRTMQNAVSGAEKNRYVWILKAKFAPTAETATTKAPNGINPQYPQITGSAITRLADGQIKINIDDDDTSYLAEVGTNWFTQATLQKLYDGAVTVMTQPVSVVESPTGTFPTTGFAGVLYVDTTVAATPVYKFWTGTAYATINSTEIA